MADLGIEIPKGSPGGIRAGASALKSAMGSLEGVYSGLHASGSIAGWRGMAALAYRSTADMQAQSTGYAFDAFLQAAHALMRAADVLEEARQDAKQALELAREADSRMQAAQARIDAALEAEAAARDQIAQLDFHAAIAPPLPWHPAQRAAAGAAMSVAADDRTRAQSEFQQAEADLHDAQKKARIASLRWKAEGERTGQELGGLAGSASAVPPALGFGLPRPALGGGGGSLSFSPFLPLPGAPRRLTPSELAERERRANDDDDDFLDGLKPPIPSIAGPPPLKDIWDEAKKRAGWIGLGACYGPKAWKDKDSSVGDEIRDLAECELSPVVKDDHDEDHEPTSGGW